MNKQKQLEQLSREISEKKTEISEFVESNEYAKARKSLSELKRLNKRFGKLKGEIRNESITDEDVQKLRNIKPHRKSVQNMTDLEVAQTPKFEKLLYTELGEKSPYEMRNGNLDWRNDASKTVTVIEVQKRDIPDKLTEVRKDQTIPRGTFVNRDTGIEIYFGRKAIEEIIAKAIPDNKRDIPVDARMAALYQMQEVIEKAICFDSKVSDYDSVASKNKSPNTLFLHRMHVIMSYEGKDYLANLSVEELYSTDKESNFKNTSNRLYSFRDIEITPVKLLGDQAHTNLQNTSRDTSTGVIAISIPQLYEIVKTYDQSFFENPKAVGREEREVEQYINAKFDDAKAELKTGNSSTVEKDKQISRYAKNHGITDAQAAEELTMKAERFKEERDILRGKINEINNILTENPALMKEYRAKRDEHRERQKSKSKDVKKPKNSKH